MEKSDYQQAIVEFNKSTELEPLDHEAYNNRGEAYFKLGNYQQARDDFNKALIAINNGHEPNPGGFVGLAEINKRFNIQFPRQSLEAKYYRNRGLAYEKLGNKNQATKDLKTAAMVGDQEAQKYLLSKEMAW